MEKFNNIGLARELTSCYDFQGFTEQEVWSRIAQKINIIIEHFNYLDKKIENEKENNKNKFNYLLGQGLTEQVAKAILEKINDGTLGELINERLLTVINNLEAHKKTSLRMIGSYAPKSNSGMFLSPVMLNFSVRKLNGKWTHMNWDNIISGSENIIKDITARMNSSLGYHELTITLNIKLTSYAQCIVTAEQSLFISGYTVHGQLDANGTIVRIRFKKTTESDIIDPNTLTDGNGVIVTLIGGMKI